MAEQDVLDKIDDVLDKIADNKDKLVELEAKVGDVLSLKQSKVFTCRACHGVGCAACDNTGLVPRAFSGS